MKFGSFQQFMECAYFGIIRKFLAFHPVESQQKQLFLTFDDGPEPGITEFILDLLTQYQAKATFFCCGHNVDANPQLFEQIRSAGHSIGNHTYSHINGLATAPRAYLDDVKKCDERTGKTILFHPPWGMLNLREIYALRHKTLVLWDAESGDVRSDYSLEKVCHDIDRCLDTQGNCIVLFHFSNEHENRTRAILPQLLEYYTEKGCVFLPINCQSHA